MKTLICYKTKGGATEKYAKWLAESVDGDIKKFEDIDKDDFNEYETIVVSSGTYAGFMPLTRFLKRNWKRVKGKKVIAVAVGAAPADDKWSELSYNRIPTRIRENIQYYKLMGEDPEPARKDGYKSKVLKTNLQPVVEYIQN